MINIFKLNINRRYLKNGIGGFLKGRNTELYYLPFITFKARFMSKTTCVSAPFTAIFSKPRFRTLAKRQNMLYNTL